MVWQKTSPGHTLQMENLTISVAIRLRRPPLLWHYALEKHLKVKRKNKQTNTKNLTVAKHPNGNLYCYQLVPFKLQKWNWPLRTCSKRNFLMSLCTSCLKKDWFCISPQKTKCKKALYAQSESCVCVLGTMQCLFPGQVKLCLGWPLSPILFVVFMDEIVSSLWCFFTSDGRM